MREIVIACLIIYLLLISVVAFVITIVDKSRARRNMRRISESALLTVSAIGGSVAMYLTMQAIRHKTKHVKFMLGLPIIILFQIVAVVYVFTRVL